MSPQAVIGLSWAEWANLAQGCRCCFASQVEAAMSQALAWVYDEPQEKLLLLITCSSCTNYAIVKATSEHIIPPAVGTGPTPSKFRKLFGLLSIKDLSLAGHVVAALCGTLEVFQREYRKSTRAERGKFHTSYFLQTLLMFVGLLEKKHILNNFIFIPFSHKAKSLQEVKREYVHDEEKLWIHASLSWLKITTSDPSAKIILVKALEMKDPVLPLGPLLPAFMQRWGITSFIDRKPTVGKEILGQLIHSTLSDISIGLEVVNTMLMKLPKTPIWVDDHSMIITIAACCHTSIFHWGENERATVLPSCDTFSSVLEHHTALEELALPMWM
ncbi:hypothetical protein DFH08DRAFT_807186 [Mycena albidolilacea]|uniref:Uncharacterized protein n=1 Tax=Mycena albidolilacea TaxID=1033008 RepID=A0AAD7A6B5_9AGAR|nr:hypothetical protein DFH08DRAFT_807186 [Mycena albidolilacea]